LAREERIKNKRDAWSKIEEKRGREGGRKGGRTYLESDELRHGLAVGASVGRVGHPHLFGVGLALISPGAAGKLGGVLREGASQGGREGGREEE